MMQQLSEQAQKLVDEFKRRVDSLPAEEREVVIREMTESISALNEDVKRTFNIFRDEESNVISKEKSSADDIRDAI